MRLDRILDAAVNSMIRGHHAAHCYRAWIKGQGYVNDGSRVDLRADYLIQLERDARAEIDNMGFAAEYAEPGYTQPKRGVLMANWNVLPRGLDTILERAGYAIEWSDEWSTCESCNRAVRTQPDSYFWEPAYKLVNDSELLCTECYADEHGDSDDSESATE